MEELFLKIDKLLDESDHIAVAIDGMSGAGKTTLAGILKEKYDCRVVSTDSFFLPKARKTPARLSEIGGNVDYERFIAEVAKNIGSAIEYRHFDCVISEYSGPVCLPSARLTVVEGVYSLHPSFGDIYDLKVFLKIDEATQQERILKRSGEKKLARYINEWIPMENRYFEQIADSVDIFL